MVDKKFCAYCGRLLQSEIVYARGSQELWLRCPKWGTFIGFLMGSGFAHTLNLVSISPIKRFDPKTGQKVENT